MSIKRAVHAVCRNSRKISRLRISLICQTKFVNRQKTICVVIETILECAKQKHGHSGVARPLLQGGAYMYAGSTFHRRILLVNSPTIFNKLTDRTRSFNHFFCFTLLLPTNCDESTETWGYRSPGHILRSLHPCMGMRLQILV